MAALVVSLAFDVKDLDFNAPFRTTFATTLLSGEEGGWIDLPDVVIGTVSYAIPALNTGFTSGLRNDWGGSRSQFLVGDGFTYAPDQSLIGGTASLAGGSVNGEVFFGLAAFSAPAVDWAAASRTAANADDIAVFNAALTGNDRVILSAFNDVLNSGLGRDLIIDKGGADRIVAGGGNDVVLVGKGNDSADGGLGNDVVIGALGNDTVLGGAGDDIIWGGVGSDTLTGGLGADGFLFKAGDGSASITDFNAAEDQILFMGPVSGLANLNIVRFGDNVRITFSDVSVLLLNTLRSEVTLADIAVGGATALNTATAAFFDGWDYSA